MSDIANAHAFGQGPGDGSSIRDQQVDDQSAKLEWRDGKTPVSRQFDDPYFSLDNGLAETRHVFLDGNDLPARFTDGFHVAELGFGTGLNLLTLIEAWQSSGTSGQLQFTSFEAYPLLKEDAARALEAFPALAPLATLLLKDWSRQTHTREVADGVIFNLVIGDAAQTLPMWDGSADAWFLDGFSPANNPQLWTPELMVEVARHTGPNGTAATYTAAGFVRRGLAEAGFTVTRTQGFGRKRHMTRAHL